MLPKLRKLSRRVLLRHVLGLKCLQRLGKLSKGDYYDCVSEFVMKKVLQSNSNCVDIGCHLGDVLEPMMKFAPKGRFFAFEPLPKLFAHLQNRFGCDSRVKLFDCALSDTEGEDVFQYIVSAPAYSGFRKTEGKANSEIVETIHVKKARLDQVLGEFSVDLIKIDVEGAELQVLQGGLETLRRCKPYVLFEHCEHALLYGTKPKDIFDLLCGDCGLSISLLDAFLQGGHPLSKHEFERVAKTEFYFLAHGR